MRNKQVYLLLALFCFAPGQPSFAIGGVDTAPSPAAQHSGSFTHPKEAKLENGLQIFVVERHDLPKIALTLATRAGGLADPAGKERMREYELTVVAGYLFDSTINIFSLVCSGFLDRWPTLKLICAHTGAFSLSLRARMQREVDTNPIIAGNLRRPVGEYLRQLYFDSICFEPRMLQYALEVVPAEHILLGSDAPFPLGEADPVGFVRRALPSAQAEGILGGNLKRLLGK